MTIHISGSSRWVKMLAIVVALIVLCPLAWLLAERIRGASALSKRMRELAARGERLELEALIPQRADTGTDAAAEWPNLVDELNELSELALSTPPTLRYSSSGHAVLSWRLTEWKDHQKTNRWSDMAPRVQSASNLLIKLHSAADKPRFDAGVDYRKGFHDLQAGPLIEVKRAARLLSLATIYELSRNNMEAASHHLEALIRLSRQKVEPLIIWQLVRQACATIALDTTWQFLQHPAITDEQLILIQSALHAVDFEADMGTALETERAMVIDFFRQIRESPDVRERVIGGRTDLQRAFGAWPSWADTFEPIRMPLWRVAWADQDQLRSLNRCQWLIDLQRATYSNGWVSVWQLSANSNDERSFPFLNYVNQPAAESAFDRFRFVFSDDLFGMSEHAIRRTVAVQTQNHMTQAAVALKRYQLRTGRLPESLDELVPEFLPGVPQDRMDHKPLRYVRLTRDSYRLYSVGENGRDDEGNPARPDNSKSYSQIWDGQDAVWPKPASAEDAEAAVKKRP